MSDEVTNELVSLTAEVTKRLDSDDVEYAHIAVEVEKKAKQFLASDSIDTKVRHQIFNDVTSTLAKIAVEAMLDAEADTDAIYTTCTSVTKQVGIASEVFQRHEYRERFENVYEDLERQESDTERFSEWVARTLHAVEKRVTTDVSSTHDASFAFTFVDDGDDVDDDDVDDDDEDDVTVTVTVSSEAAWDRKAMWMAVTQKLTNTYPDRHDSDAESSWDNTLAEQIEDVGEDVVSETGPRTSALLRLARSINDSVAFASKRDAIEEGGVWVDSEPPNHDEIWVPREMVASVRDTDEISDRAMQEEIAQRNLHVQQGMAVSHAADIDDAYTAVMWRLDASFVEDVLASVSESDDVIEAEDVFAAYRTEADVDDALSRVAKQAAGSVQSAVTDGGNISVGDSDDGDGDGGA